MACRQSSGGKSAEVAKALPGKVDFNQHVQPILSEYCYACHGFDAAARKAELRLDREEFAFAKRKNGPAIVRGQPDKSPLIQLLTSTDPKRVMPPPESHKTMKPEEIALLRQWVAEGAVWADHWAFVKPAKVPPPKFEPMPEWVKNDIDRHIWERLQKEGLKPNEEADKRSLIRRVSLDLTGLLPTAAEVDAFVNDASPGAYEKVVDRLLASPRYGEHRARYWLDYVRYADTHGIHFDNYRSIWPYRDYVIRAFNQNKPFDVFTREQLAGDLLAATNLDAVVATGFLRCNPTSNEGGGVPEEFQVNNVRDRVETFSAVYLGLTAQCAACHDHKFDPMTMKDHYQLFAFFNNTAELAWDLNSAEPKPLLRVPVEAKRTAFDAMLAKRAAVEAKLDARRKEIGQLVSKKLNGDVSPKHVKADGLVLRLKLDEGAGNTVKNSAPGAKPASFTSAISSLVWNEEWVHWPSVRMDISTKLDFGNIGDFDAKQAFSGSCWVMVRGEPGGGDGGRGAKAGTVFAKVDDSAGKAVGWELLMQNGVPAVHFLDGATSVAIRVISSDRFTSRSVWYHVAFTYDGSGKAAGIKLYVDGNPVAMKVEADNLKGSIKTTAPLHLGRRHPDSNALKQARYQDVRIYARELSAKEVARLPVEDIAAEINEKSASSWTPDQRHTMAWFYETRADKDLPGWKTELEAIEKELETLGTNGVATLIAEEKANRQPAAFVLKRGVYSHPGERVFPGFPHFLPQPAGATPARDRRDLAEWVLSVENPLTARVVVNRMWQEVFGAGLVDTAEDFGIMGQRPTNPQLLDWLSNDFREHGWDVKRFYKQLVMSATYRQSSVAKPDAAKKDPRNRLFSRGPRFRMDAEMLRDSALQSAGLLVEKQGGPSVKPYQPPGIWEAVTMPESNTLKYQQDKGDNLYRRSLYTFWKRFAPPPTMETFDAPGRDVACLRRQRTNTPLQALVTLNSTEFVEASRKLAERILREGGADPASRIDYLGRTLLARPFDDIEKAALQKHLADFAKHYNANVAEAAKLLKVGDSAADATLPAADLAAWTVLASQVLNTDEALNK